MTCDLREKILQYNGRVPRYTSYPAAPHFQIDENRTGGHWVKTMPEGTDLSLYIHIPFCQKMCWYCGCHTKITRRYAPIEDYVHLVVREIDLLAAALPGDHRIKQIHFGGGSPGLVRATDFALIMDRIRSHFSVADSAEIAIEIDPRNISEGRVATYAKHGVNRISLGVQDFNNKTLKAVNREQPFHLTYEGLKLIRGYGIKRINMDVLYGLPHQNVETVLATLEKVLLLNPDRVAFFGYAHVPWMKKHMRMIDEGTLPKEDLRFDIFHAGTAFLNKAGYKTIGIDHFAKGDDPLYQSLQNGTLRRNFQGYTTDQTPALIGIGASAIGQTKNGFIQNHPDLPLYKQAILAGDLPIKKICPIGKDDKIRARIIESLMCYSTVNLNEICRDFGLDPSDFSRELDALKPYETLGFVTCDGGVITIHPEAILMVRTICSIFDRYFQPQNNADAPRHARAI